MGKKWLILGTFMVLVPVLVWASGIEIPDGDPLKTLLDLFQNWKALSPVAIGAAIVCALAQGVKSILGDGFKYKRLLVTVLGVLWGVLMTMSSGLTLLQAFVMVITVSGGAVAIYEAIKGLHQAVTQ